MHSFSQRDDPDRFVPSCTVVIATRDRPALLDRCLEAVAGVDYPRFDVLVVDNAPRDTRTQEVAARRGIRYIIEPLCGVNRARNRGARNCDAEIIAYLDDDAVPEPAWLSGVVEEFKDPRVMAITGRILPLTMATEAERLLAQRTGFDLGEKRRSVDREIHHWFEKANFGDIGAEANMAFRRSAFDVWPGFDERIGCGTPIAGGEGPHAFFSLIERGYRVVYTPHAVVYHPCPQTLEDLRSRSLRTVAASAGYITLLFFEHPRYWGAIMRYVTGRFRGIPRAGHANVEGPRSRILPRWRQLLACLPGPLLYARSLLAHKLSRVKS